MKDLQEAKKILGMEMARDKVKDIIHLTQKTYLKKMLEWFGIDGKSKLVSKLLVRYFKLRALLSLSMKEEHDLMA